MKLPKLNQYHGNLNNIKSYNIQVLLMIQNIAGIQPAEELDGGLSFTSSICELSPNSSSKIRARGVSRILANIYDRNIL